MERGAWNVELGSDDARRSRETAHMTHASALLADFLTQDLARAVRDEGDHLMPMKGVLTQRLLGRVGHRWMCDVDLLVAPGAEQAHARALRGMGFESAFQTPTSETWTRADHPLSVDWHFQPFPHGMFHLPVADLVARSTIDGALFEAPIRRLDPCDHFLILLGHLGKGLETQPQRAEELQRMFERLDLDLDVVVNAIGCARMRTCCLWLARWMPANHAVGRMSERLEVTSFEQSHVALLSILARLPSGRVKNVIGDLIADRPVDAARALASHGAHAVRVRARRTGQRWFP